MTNMMGDLGFASFSAILPELYMCGMTLALIIIGVYRMQRSSDIVVLMGLVIMGVTAYGVAVFSGARSVEMNGMFVTSHFTDFAKILLLLAGAMVLLLSASWLKEEEGRPFEFVVLMLLSMLGMMLMVSAGDLLVVYLGLEMSSLALYVLASFSRDNTKSSEAGLKYFVLGALASGMMLFGMSLVYGFAGSTSFGALERVFANNGGIAAQGTVVGVVMIITGFCFKLSAAPFHMWTPDVYEGAPTPVTAFFATAPKVAAFGLFIRIMLEPFGPLIGYWQQVIIFVALASMIVGALAAMMQTNIKRLLAYSSIGHAGFMLMGLAAGTSAGVEAILFYLAVYIFMSVGAFGCVLLMTRDGKPVEDIKELSGLSQTSPIMALAMATFMFSLAGIPPLAGFFGKLYILLAVVEAGLTWLAVVAVAITVIGCYYYLKVIKVMYFDAPAQPFDKHIPFSLKAGVIIAAAVTLFFFITPTPLVKEAKSAAETVVSATETVVK